MSLGSPLTTPAPSPASASGLVVFAGSPRPDNQPNPLVWPSHHALGLLARLLRFHTPPGPTIGPDNGLEKANQLTGIGARRSNYLGIGGPG